jgi:hypothetical protein
MGDPYIRVTGHVEDIDGVQLAVGVDYDTVTIGRWRLGLSMCEEFGRLFIAACWEAARNVPPA